MNEKEVSEIEEIKDILTAITEFIKDISGPLKDLISVIESSIAGDKLARDISEFYKGLKDSGLPDDIINDLVKKYYDDRVSTLRSLGKILEMAKARHPSVIVSSTGNEEAKRMVMEFIKKKLEEKKSSESK